MFPYSKPYLIHNYLLYTQQRYDDQSQQRYDSFSHIWLYLVSEYIYSIIDIHFDQEAKVSTITYYP